MKKALLYWFACIGILLFFTTCSAPPGSTATLYNYVIGAGDVSELVRLGDWKHGCDTIYGHKNKPVEPPSTHRFDTTQYKMSFVCNAMRFTELRRPFRTTSIPIGNGILVWKAGRNWEVKKLP